MDSLKGYVADDHLAIEPLRELGHVAERVSWRQTAEEWREYGVVIIRSTWDYQNEPEAFFAVLREIESQTRLANPLGIVRWNADKEVYLRDLEKLGARIVPAVWNNSRIEGRQIEQWFRQFQADELVVKPTVGANAKDVVRLKRGPEAVATLGGLFDGRPCIVQPFMRAIVEEGEFSLFYFNGEYSHAILKTPKAGDFRVQEEHGGFIQPTEPSPKLLAAGEKILRHISPPLLYARADFVRDGEEFALMELELIEPSMYLRMAEHAPRAFAEAIDEWLSEQHP